MAVMLSYPVTFTTDYCFGGRGAVKMNSNYNEPPSEKPQMTAHPIGFPPI